MALNQDSSATQVEQDFLRGVVSTPHHWTEQSIDEDYFAIPEDNTILNSSLSASLSSLCNKDSDPEVRIKGCGRHLQTNSYGANKMLHL